MSTTERLASSLLTNPGADRVKAVASLARRSVRTKRDVFLAEGPQNVREVLVEHLRGSSEWAPRLDSLYVTSTFLGRYPEIAEYIGSVLSEDSAHRVFIRMVTDDVLSAMAQSQSPQGAVAVCAPPKGSLEDCVTAHLGQNSGFVAVMCRVQDPGNAGTIIRAADAAGASAVVMTKGSVDLYNPKTVRSTAGSIFHVPVFTQVDFQDLVMLSRGVGAHVIAADGYAELDLDEIYEAALHGKKVSCDLSAPTMWLFGNEAQGLSQQEKTAADHGVAVPLYGRAESLNVATAATLCLYASARVQRRAAHHTD